MANSTKDKIEEVAFVAGMLAVGLGVPLAVCGAMLLGMAGYWN